MIGWQPRKGFDGPWHLSIDHTPEVSLCGVRVARVDRYVKRDPHKIDKYGGVRCAKCWMEWRLRDVVRFAPLDPHERTCTE
jgi:hypothetical protein